MIHVYLHALFWCCHTLTPFAGLNWNWTEFLWEWVELIRIHQGMGGIGQIFSGNGWD